MQLLMPLASLAIVVAAWGSAWADENLPFGAVPSTISEKAQNVLRTAPVSDPDQVRPTRTLEKILQDRKAYDVFDETYSAKAIERYAATIDEIAPIKAKNVDVRIHVITPETISKASERFALVWIHGGGSVLAAFDRVAGAGVPVSSLTGIRTYSVGYRLAPEHPYPAALEDCLAVYRQVIREYKPRRVAVFGASAGGNLAVALVLKARQERLPLPGCVVAITPWSDLAKRGDNYNTLAGKEPILQN